MSVISGGFARNRANANSNNGSNEDRKVGVWMNVGFRLNVGTEQERFMSLRTGIPLDTMDLFEIRRGSTEASVEYAEFQESRNFIIQRFKDMGADLGPGQSLYVGFDNTKEPGEGDLCLQIRRVNEAEAEAPPATVSGNRFLKQLFGEQAA